MTAPKNVSLKIQTAIDSLTLDVLREAKRSDDIVIKLQVMDRGMKWYALKEKLGVGDDDAGSVLDSYGRAASAAPVNTRNGQPQEPPAGRREGSTGPGLPDFGAFSAEEAQSAEETPD